MALGLLLSALSGAGQGAGASLEQSQRFDQEQQLMQQKSDLDSAKAIAVAQATQQNAADLADQQREQQASRISAAASPYLQQAVLANALADKASGLAPTAAYTDLNDAQKAQYAPTPMQVLQAHVNGAKDTGDLQPQGLLNAQVQTQAHQDTIDMQKATLAQQAAIAEAQMKNSKDIAGIYANRGGAGNALDPQAAFAVQEGAKLDAQAKAMDIDSNEMARRLQDISPKNPDGTPNPDFVAQQNMIQSMRTQAADLRKRSTGLYAFGAGRAGVPQSVVDMMSGASAQSGAAAPNQPAMIYDAKSGKIVPIGVPAAMPGAPQNDMDGAASGDW